MIDMSKSHEGTQRKNIKYSEKKTVEEMEKSKPVVKEKIQKKQQKIQKKKTVEKQKK
jgi:hypothetical protein